jgi:hypothetical protein
LVLAGLALPLCFASVGFSGDAVYQARLAGVDEYAQAYGRAVWTADPRKATLEVSVSDCYLPQASYTVSVVVDRTFVGNLRITGGSASGVFTIMPTQERPEKLEIYLHHPRSIELLMQGNFRK